MKLKVWLLSALAPLTALSVLAQVSTSVPPVLSPPPPVPSTVEPAPEPAAEPAAKPVKQAKPKHHKAKARQAKASSATNAVVVIDPPVTATVKCDVLDVRGQGSFAGEVITHVKKGDSVTVSEEITLAHVHAGEPHQWSRIAMPTNASLWVSADYIDSETNAVRVKKVNVRGGPGENYSVVARLDKGSVVKVLDKKEGWLQIEAPTNAYAFVASEYLEKQGSETPAPVVATAPSHAALDAPSSLHVDTSPPVVVNVPAETPPPGLAAPAPTPASQVDQELAALHRATAPEPLMGAPSAPQPAILKEETPRIVTREGFVHRAFDFQAPEGYELHDIKTGELTEYLQPARGQKLKAYVGTRVRIVGSESLDPSSPRTPILQIQTIDLMP